MTLLRRADVEGPVWCDNWPRARRLPLVGSAAERTLKDAIRRYVNGEITGRSFLIAGHRGAGKTTLVRNVVEDLIDEILQREDLRARSPIKPDSILAMPQRPLLVRLHGPSLLLDELPGPGAGETPTPADKPDAHVPSAAPPSEPPQAERAAEAAADAAATPPASTPGAPKPEVAQSTLVQVTMALWRALAAECAGAFSIHARSMQPSRRPSALEIAARLQLDLDQAPEPALLRSYWARFDALDRGVLWPTNVGQAMSDAGFGGQGLREIIAVATTAQIFEVCAGKVEFSRTKKDTSQTENRTGQDGGRALADALGRLPGLGLGAALGAGAAGTLSQSLPLSLAGGLLGALALSWTSTNVQARASGLDYSIVLDRSVTTLERDLPVAIERIRQAGLAPIFVVDELDKIEKVEGTIRTLIRRLKQLTTDDAVFCFLTDREYFATVQRKVEREAYPVEHTFFSERLYVLHTPADLDRYIEGQFLDLPAPAAPGMPSNPDRQALLVLAKLILHGSKLNMIDARRALARGWQDDSWGEAADSLRQRLPNVLRVALQLAVEHALCATDVDERARLDGSFRQLLVDALYMVSRAWEQDHRSVSLQRQEIARALLKRLGTPPGDDPWDRLIAMVDEADARLLVEAARKVASLTVKFDALRAALSTAGVPEMLVAVIPNREGLLIPDEAADYVFWFRYDQFGRDLVEISRNALSADEVYFISVALDFSRAFQKGLRGLGLGFDDLVRLGYLPDDMSDAAMAARQTALGMARDDREDYAGYAADRASIASLRDLFRRTANSFSKAIVLGLLTAHDSGISVRQALETPGFKPFAAGATARPELLAGMPYTDDLPVPEDGFDSEPAVWTTSMFRLRDGLLALPVRHPDLGAAWERRAVALSSPFVSPAPEPVWHYEDLVLMVQRALPIGLVRVPLETMPLVDRSLVALEAASTAIIWFSDPPETVMPSWLLVPALHSLGFGADMLSLVAKALPAFRHSETVTKLLTILTETTSPSGAGFVTLIDTAGHPAADVQGPVSYPVFVLRDGQNMRYKEAVDWLTDCRIFKGVVDERTARPA